MSPHNVAATFSALPVVTHDLVLCKSGTGRGTVVSVSPPSPVINCDPDCPGPIMTTFPGTALVLLQATAERGSTFTRWEVAGQPNSSGPSRGVAMSVDREVTAVFTLNTYTLTVTKDFLNTRTGTVTSDPVNAAEHTVASMAHLTQPQPLVAI